MVMVTVVILKKKLKEIGCWNDQDAHISHSHGAMAMPKSLTAADLVKVFLGFLQRCVERLSLALRFLRIQRDLMCNDKRNVELDMLYNDYDKLKVDMTSSMLIFEKNDNKESWSIMYMVWFPL